MVDLDRLVPLLNSVFLDTGCSYYRAVAGPLTGLGQVSTQRFVKGALDQGIDFVPSTWLLEFGAEFAESRPIDDDSAGWFDETR